MQSPPHPDKAQTVMNKIAALLARIILLCFRTKQTHFQYSLIVGYRLRFQVKWIRLHYRSTVMDCRTNWQMAFPFPIRARLESGLDEYR
jgi:hypothetical protein